MWYLHSLALPHLTRRGAGLFLVVLLHLAVLIALKNGLVNTIPTIAPPTQITMIERQRQFVRPEYIPPTVQMKTWTLETHQPVIETIETAVTATTTEIPTSIPTQTTEGAATIPTTAARVDPRHPLTQPPYPAQSRRLGEAGSVELMLYVLPNGRIGEAQVARSSGFVRLDEAAVREALRTWRLLPNTENGVAVAGWSRITVTFRLNR